MTRASRYLKIKRGALRGIGFRFRRTPLNGLTFLYSIEDAMPTTPLDRLLFAQGGNCFFCDQPLARDQASVEHLVASSKGGSNTDGNCVVCCQAVNALFGSMSLKEKFRVVLNQRGAFRCPNGAGVPPPESPSAKASPPEPSNTSEAKSAYEMALAHLRKRKKCRPVRPKTLRSDLATLFPGTAPEVVEAVVDELKAAGKLKEVDGKVNYFF